MVKMKKIAVIMAAIMVMTVGFSITVGATSGAAGFGDTVVTTDANGFEGECIKVEQPSDGMVIFAANLVSGQKYKISAHVKVTHDDTITVLMGGVDTFATAVTAGEWYYIAKEVAYTGDTDNTTVAFKSSTANTFYLDNVSVTPLGKRNLIRGGSFDIGTNLADNWSVTNNNMTLCTTDGYSELGAAKLDMTYGDNYFTQKNVGMEAGKNYDLTFMIKPIKPDDVTDNAVTVRCLIKTGHEWNTSLGMKVLYDTKINITYGEWQKVACTITMPADKEDLIAINIVDRTFPTYLIDDVKVTENTNLMSGYDGQGDHQITKYPFLTFVGSYVYAYGISGAVSNDIKGIDGRTTSLNKTKTEAWHYMIVKPNTANIDTSKTYRLSYYLKNNASQEFMTEHGLADIGNGQSSVVDTVRIPYDGEYHYIEGTTTGANIPSDALVCFGQNDPNTIGLNFSIDEIELTPVGTGDLRQLSFAGEAKMNSPMTATWKMAAGETAASYSYEFRRATDEGVVILASGNTTDTTATYTPTLADTKAKLSCTVVAYDANGNALDSKTMALPAIEEVEVLTFSADIGFDGDVAYAYIENDNVAKSICIVAATYNSDGTLKSVSKLYEGTLAAREATTDAAFDEEWSFDTTGAANAKIFLLDNLSTMKPYVTAVPLN